MFLAMRPPNQPSKFLKSSCSESYWGSPGPPPGRVSKQYTHNQFFSHLTNSKFRAGLSGVSSDTPSFWKPQFIFQKRDLLQKTENLHATLDWEVYLRIINFFHIWQIQNLEQVYPVSVLLLPAPESLKSFFKNTIYCKKLKICMRPWIRKL